MYYNSNTKNLVCKCETCGNVGTPKPQKKGSFWIGLFLWCFLLIPGIIYSIWRRTGDRTAVCPFCGSMSLKVKKVDENEK